MGGPSLETRSAIIQAKAAAVGLMLPEFEPHERGGAIGVWAATGGAAAAASVTPAQADVRLAPWLAIAAAAGADLPELAEDWLIGAPHARAGEPETRRRESRRE